MNPTNWKTLLRHIGILLMAEGTLMALCLIPEIHFHGPSTLPIATSAAFTLAVGALLTISYPHHRHIDDRRFAYLLVTLIWIILALFASLPFLATGTTPNPIHAWFEAMSGITSTGATIFPNVATLPPSLLLWRSITQWFGGYGIILLVLALIPRLGINKYALYTAEASGADNTGRRTTPTTVTLRRTLTIYLLLTLLYILLLILAGLHPWDAVNLTFTNISSGGFSINTDSISSLTHPQQYILAAAMFTSGINFTLLYHLLTLRWQQIHHKLDQLRAYILLTLTSALLISLSLHLHHHLPPTDALRIGTIQTISAITTTGSAVADTTPWAPPLLMLLLLLSICGSMAGSTSGGIKTMRLLILYRNARSILRDRLHPNAVNPIRLNGQPVSNHLIANVMVIFIVYILTLLIATLALLLTGIDPTQAIGASIGCLTGYGPGLGPSGGLGSYAAFPNTSLLICTLLMLLGRLECMTVLILLLPRFWKH